MVDSLDGIADSKPSNFNFNMKNPAGNYVVIDHGNNEFSIFAHLKNGSVRVAKGNHVEAGDLLGKVGNSGNTTQPHLHYHMQNSAEIFNGEGLPVQFNHYYANGVFIERGEPVQGEIIYSQ